MTRPRLVYSGPGMTPAAIAEEASVEEQALEHEARQLTRALRLIAMQTRIWTPEQLERALIHTADQVERRMTPPKRAA